MPGWKAGLVEAHLGAQSFTPRVGNSGRSKYHTANKDALEEVFVATNSFPACQKWKECVASFGRGQRNHRQGDRGKYRDRICMGGMGLLVAGMRRLRARCEHDHRSVDLVLVGARSSAPTSGHWQCASIRIAHQRSIHRELFCAEL